jgi:hypothetical protein
MKSIEYYITSNDVFIIISLWSEQTTVLSQRHATGFAKNSSTKSGHNIYYECSFVVRCNIFSFTYVTIYTSTHTSILVPYTYGHY